MDEGRLKAVKKGQKLHRKFAYAMNDTIRNRQEYYQTCLSREEQETHARLMSKVINIRKNVVRNRVLLQCLNLHRKVSQAVMVAITKIMIIMHMTIIIRRRRRQRRRKRRTITTTTLTATRTNTVS
ncbi:transport protein Sec16A [Elysia marginata]|uniref:Transport protein Sec16A n=1 Tax=Elysia marginata TaxID=1093978 RepID=A0AAV4FTW2_9GAST|nr:transport protein Sec16A [Elysia marginata]